MIGMPVTLDPIVLAFWHLRYDITTWSWFDMHSEALVVSRLGISGRLSLYLND